MNLSNSTKLTRATGTETTRHAMSSRSGDTIGTAHPTTTFWIGNVRPARAVAGVSSLHYGALLEIEATAIVGQSG